MQQDMELRRSQTWTQTVGQIPVRDDGLRVVFPSVLLPARRKIEPVMIHATFSACNDMDSS